jgi:diguanylate cyclase (GGDEF)-like protein
VIATEPAPHAPLRVFHAEIEACLGAAAADACTGVMHVQVLRHRQLVLALGFDIADAVQAAVGTRLREALRAGDRVVHVGGGEFAVLLPGLLSTGHAQLAAQRVLREFERPLTVAGRTVTVAVAIGLAVAPAHGRSAHMVARRALAALDDALRYGTRLVVGDALGEDPVLLDELREALAANALSIEFQPIVRTADGVPVAAEALARWRHPQRGNIAPSVFVPLAEQAGLAPELTRWSLNAALRDYAQLLHAHPGLACSLNLSTRVFDDSGLVEQVIAALDIWNVPPDRLIVEVTETAVIEDAGHSARALRALRAAGVGVAIDDFGKGYSSFNYLKHFPANELKIDSAFVLALDGDARAGRLLKSMIDLAHNLELRVVAEGVESASLARQLVDLGCDFAQGWHYGRPRPRAQFGT